MNINQKGFVNIVLIVLVVILAGTVGYFALIKKSEPIAQQPNPTQTQTTIQAETSVSPTTPSATEQSEKDTETSQNNIAPKKTPMAVPLSDLLSLNPYANAKHKYKIFAPKE